MRPFKPRARAAKTSMQMRHEGYGGGLRAPSWPKLPCPPPHGLRAKTSTPSWSSLQMRHVAHPPDRDSCLRGGWGGGVLHPNRVIGVFVTVAAGSIAVSLSRMTSNCDPEVSRRPRQVGTRRVQTPTHIPPPLPSVYTHQARCLAVRGPQAHLPKSYQSYQFWIQSSLGSTKHRCMRPRRLPAPRPPPRELREPIYIRKK